MNWNLIVRLSFFGFVMGGLTVSLVPSFIEPIFWVAIYVFCAYVIARRCSEKFFLNGFMVSMLNSAWITGFHVIFYNTYFNAHPEMDLLYASLPWSDYPRLGMIIFAPVFGLLFGTVLGLFSLIASKLIKKPDPRVK